MNIDVVIEIADSRILGVRAFGAQDVNAAKDRFYGCIKEMSGDTADAESFTRGDGYCRRWADGDYIVEWWGSLELEKS